MKPRRGSLLYNRTTTKYAANDLAEDLTNNLAEIQADTEDTLDAIRDADYDGSEWEALRNAIAEARTILGEMERTLDLKQIEADNAEREDAREEYESFWD